MRHRDSRRPSVGLVGSVVSVFSIALTLVVGGCAPGGSGGEDAQGGAAAGSGGGGGDGPPRNAPTSAPPPPEQVLASHDGSSGEVPVRVEVNDLFRRGQLVTLNFSVTYRASDGEQSGRWQIADAFGDGDHSNGSDTTDGVYLVDSQNGKRHPVARDGEDRCVCSTGLGGTFVTPGQTVALTATFAAPPPDVEAVDVRVPLAGTFADVSIR